MAQPRQPKDAAKPKAARKPKAAPKPKAAANPKHEVDLTPNPLITDIATALSDVGVPGVRTAPGDIASEFHKLSQIPGLVTLTGFLGGVVKEPNGTEWLVLFADWELSRWVVVPRDAIYRRESVDDPEAAGKRDVIWVKADASVGTGSGSQAIEARFLTGEFTRAGDVATLAGGPTPPATGDFCRSSGCCLFRTRRP